MSVDKYITDETTKRPETESSPVPGLNCFTVFCAILEQCYYRKKLIT